MPCVPLSLSCTDRRARAPLADTCSSAQGKTDVALLTILRCLSQLASQPLTSLSAPPSLPPASSYKIVYVAPLKALAAEVTQKFAKRLGWAGVKVRELTGDMKLTRKEVDETGVIVTTPEKWDVVTRKGAGSGDGDVAEVRLLLSPSLSLLGARLSPSGPLTDSMYVEQKVKLLIIDEVHLLHEDRGAVIESIVARTQRQVESMQSLIRIVGLSATLPNYVDVADFLGVNRYTGLFFFDSSFRPVPLEQHFVGVKGKPGSMQSRTNLDQAAFDKVAQLVKDGHQCMVFVHARKDTVKTAQTLREKAIAEGIIDLLDPSAGDDTNSKWQGFKRDLAGSRNREMKELAASGFGIHHAGMLRSDRNISERMFENNVTKVRSRSRYSPRRRRRRRGAVPDPVSPPRPLPPARPGPVLHGHPRVGRQLARLRRRHQGHAGVRRRQGRLRRPEHPRRPPDLRTRRSPAVRGPGRRLHLHDERQARPLRSVSPFLLSHHALENPL